MGNQNNPTNTTHDFYQDLATAVKKLELFTEQKKTSLLQKTINLAHTFITDTFSKKIRKRQKKKSVLVQHEVLQAVQTIQKHYLFIQKLKKGTLAQQELADLTCQVVERYNKMIYGQKKDRLNFKERIADFIDKKCGLSFDQLKEKAIYLPKVTPLIPKWIQNSEIISNYEADAFRVKAISLLRNHDNLRFKSVSEELETIKSTPILASIHSDDLKRIQMTQIVKPFPGEIIVFKGEFRRDFNAHSKSVPLKNSFEIVFNSHQTGFPSPSQYTLWALSDSMIPMSPADLELMPEVSSLLKLKQEIAASLLPKGNLIAKAKEILRIKKQVFQENLDELLSLNLELQINLYKAAPEIIRPKNGLKVIADFYSHLQKIEAPYDCLLEVQETIIQSFITEPFEKLQKAHIQEEDKNLRYHASANLLKNARKDALGALSKNLPFSEKWKLDFIVCMGMLTGETADAIILQHMSKTLGFNPPKLQLYQQKIQVALYDQLQAFQKELNIEPLEKSAILNQFIINLKNDIANLQKTYFDAIVSDSKKIVLELENYY